MLAAFAALALPAQATGAVVATPEGIYQSVRDAVDGISSPPYIAFTLQDASSRKYALEQDRVRILVRVSDGNAFVVPIRTMDGNPAPRTPRVVTGGLVPGTPIYRAGDFPLADFGLRRKASSRRGIFEADTTPEPSQSAAPGQTIATVQAVNVAYRIVNLGDTTLDGHDVYHLGLTPLYDAGHHVLREMWIDKATFLPRKYVAERFVDAGAFAFRYLVTVDTAVIDGRLVNTDAVGYFNVNRALVVHYSGEGKWSISGVSFPASLPDWLFDPQTYGVHRNDPLPPEATVIVPSPAP
jgi:hypothetical protein